MMIRQRLRNIAQLGSKELRSLLRDPIMLVLIVYAFSFSIYTAATAMPETLHKAPIAVIDEDRSQLSQHIVDALYPPYFMPPELITAAEMDARMDAGLDTFALNIPAGFQRDVLAGRSPAIQLSVDATRMSQAFTGSGHIQTIVQDQVNEFVRRYRAVASTPVELVLRARFNPELNKAWFGGVMQIINNITMLSIVLTGAALIREREHGTLEHLLVMPVTPFEIMAAKVLAMAAVVLLASAFSLNVVVRGLMGVPIEGSLPLFFTGAALHLFATTSLGIFLATLARELGVVVVGSVFERRLAGVYHNTAVVLERDSESAYYINNLHVRRRDVADIFLGTGLQLLVFVQCCHARVPPFADDSGVFCIQQQAFQFEGEAVGLRPCRCVLCLECGEFGFQLAVVLKFDGIATVVRD